MNISIHVILRLYSRAELKQCRLASSGWTSYEHTHTHTHTQNTGSKPLTHCSLLPSLHYSYCEE